MNKSKAGANIKFNDQGQIIHIDVIANSDKDAEMVQQKLEDISGQAHQKNDNRCNLSFSVKRFLQEKSKALQTLVTEREKIMQRAEKECLDKNIPLDERVELLCVFVEQVIKIIEIEQRLLRL